MSDVTQNRYFILGTGAERVLFVPDPADISSIGPGEFLLVLWVESDTGDIYYWDAVTAIDWVQISGGGGSGITQLTGEVTAGPGSGSQAATIANDAVVTAKILNANVTYAKIQNVSATARLLGRVTAGAGIMEEIPLLPGMAFAGGALTGKLVGRASTQTGAVATGTTLIPVDDTIPQIGEGDEYMTLAYTPADAANILEIQVTACVSSGNTTDWKTVALFQDAVGNALAAAAHFQNGVNEMIPITFTHTMVAGGTSAITFRVRAGVRDAGATLTFNGVSAGRIFGGVMASGIIIKEFRP